MLIDSSTLVIIRSHYYDLELAGFCCNLRRAGLRVLLAIDESKGLVETGVEFDKISITVPILKGLGLRSEPDFGWRCGDCTLCCAKNISLLRALPPARAGRLFQRSESHEIVLHNCERPIQRLNRMPAQESAQRLVLARVNLCACTGSVEMYLRGRSRERQRDR